MNCPYYSILWRFDVLLKALVFGKAVKSHRSILSWRERDILPKTTADLARVASQKTHNSPAWSGSSIFNEKSPVNGFNDASPRYDHIFGRKGEKAAGEKAAGEKGSYDKGYYVTKPLDSYSPSSPPRGIGRSNSGGSSSRDSYPRRF